MFELSMESLSSKYLMWVFILLLVQICGCKGCIEEEKMGLLEFKAFLKLNNEHADFLLPSWIDNNTSECCNWERVICNPTTGRVKKLFFNDITRQQNFLEDNWYYYENVKFWLLNVSLFLPFEELHHLNLSANSFDGFIENEELASLRNLEVLDLSYNDLESFQLLQDSKSLSIFKKLETLNLNYNKFKNTSLQQLNIFTSLKNLSLRGNHVGGFFPIQELCTLENLVMLDLRGNFFIGMQGKYKVKFWLYIYHVRT
ncbi:putative receptor-like protein 8 isoform X2 [Vitis vinifera]|uniref:putative receptor-like protein 8 isoform X2 n=1 Tax=Vitis vinifera TaxID=29760 RepID=UPI002882D866|nr:putative receptor-like protein 8 isoform X2 [Vitis vinifera]